MNSKAPAYKNICCLIQARNSSQRLPGKVLLNIGGLTVLDILLNRLAPSTFCNSFVVATTSAACDDEIAALCARRKTACFRGSEHDVLDRYYQAARKFHADAIVRITADCPLIDAALLDYMLAAFLDSKVDYACNVYPPTFPDGCDVEVFSFQALETAWHHYGIRSEREHVTHYLRSESNLAGKDIFRAVNVLHSKDLSEYRITLDTPEDLAVLTQLVNALGTDKPWIDYVHFLEQYPEMRTMNSQHERNSKYMSEQEKFEREAQQRANVSYRNSEQFLAQATERIPLGSQTFSKSILQLPFGAAPFFADHANGSKLFDIDGNEYIDLSSALLAITLGYCDPDVNAAVAKQLERGTIFSLPHTLEYDVAALICEMVPCAEMVRFGKNGSDATAGAVRLARAFTRKEHVLVCGYHGWQDWYIGSTSRHIGVPQCVRDLTHTFVYNDIDSLKTLCETYRGKIAGVVLEPVTFDAPRDNFLAKVREITLDEKIPLIFDETITGFRFAAGGAQELFGVTPDLCCLGKGLANGFPLSAIAGKKEIMTLMNDIFFSFTFGGEALSLAAAKATLNKIRTGKIIPAIWDIGKQLSDGVSSLIERYSLQQYFRMKGYSPWELFQITPPPNASVEAMRTFHLQEMFRSGIFMGSTHNITSAHSKSDVEKVIAAYDHFFDKFSWSLTRDGFASQIVGKILEPVFKVRG